MNNLVPLHPIPVQSPNFLLSSPSIQKSSSLYNRYNWLPMLLFIWFSEPLNLLNVCFCIGEVLPETTLTGIAKKIINKSNFLIQI